MEYSIYLSTYTDKNMGSTCGYKVFRDNAELSVDVALQPEFTNVQGIIFSLGEALKDVVVDLEDLEAEVGTDVKINVFFREHSQLKYTNNTKISIVTILSQFHKISAISPEASCIQVAEMASKEMKKTRQNYIEDKAYVLRIMHNLTIAGYNVKWNVEPAEMAYPVFGHIQKLMVRAWNESNKTKEKPRKMVPQQEGAHIYD